jgi:hypothetical protein
MATMTGWRPWAPALALLARLAAMAPAWLGLRRATALLRAA